jgi:hypothetical protein
MLRTTGSRNIRGRIGGWAAVVSLTLTAVGFLVMTVVVIALARSSTSRWEKARRAARAPRRKVVAPRRARATGASRRPGAALRKAVVTIRRPAPPVPRPEAGTGGPGTAPEAAAADAGPFLRRLGTLPSSLSARTFRSTKGRRSRRRPPGVASGPAPSARIPRLARRSPHRRDPTEDPQVVRADVDDSPTAR